MNDVNQGFSKGFALRNQPKSVLHFLLRPKSMQGYRTTTKES